MEKITGTTQRACLTCGKWMELPKESLQVYCSPHCGGNWKSCIVCGRYFLAEESLDGYCSEECREPAPVIPGLNLDE